MAAAAAVTGSLLLTVGCSASNSSSGSAAVSLPAQPGLVAARRVS
jgi:hypothetical protein